jgi:hypothetical protein
MHEYSGRGEERNPELEVADYTNTVYDRISLPDEFTGVPVI